MTKNDSTFDEWFKEMDGLARKVGYKFKSFDPIPARTPVWLIVFQVIYNHGFTPQEALAISIQEKLDGAPTADLGNQEKDEM